MSHESGIYYVFNASDLKKAEERQDEIALYVLQNKDDIVISTNLKMVSDPASSTDDNIIAAFDDNNFTVLRKFGAGVLEKIGTNFSNANQIAEALSNTFGKKYFKPAV